jgi:hypothetical protein
VPGLERAIAKSKGVEFGSLFHEFGADFSANPYSAAIRDILLQIDPECASRLPKRRVERPQLKPREPAAKPEKLGKQKESAASSGKPPARKKSADAARTEPTPEPPKKKPASSQSSASKSAAADKSASHASGSKKHSASEGLSKRKPR